MKKSNWKVGDRFWVVDYYAHQEAPAVFEVSKLCPKGWKEIPWVRVEAFDMANPRVKDGFGNEGSPNVWSARVIRTKGGLLLHKLHRAQFWGRKRLANWIFPEVDF